MRKIFLILALILFGLTANAQVRSSDIVLTVNPENPRPNQSVTASLNSYVTDLNKANMVWSVNGQEKLIGIGKKTFSFSTENNSSILLMVNIETLDGQNLTKSFNISTSELDLVWEAYDSYSPPYYSGKTLVGSQGKWKVVAIPNLKSSTGARINPSNLSYTWKLDGNVQADSSGWGKSSYVFQNTYLDEVNVVSVEVSDITGKTKTTGSLTLTPSAPRIVFYKHDGTMGTRWNKALGSSFSLDEEGETIVAEPYYFSPKNINVNELNFSWSINGSKIGTPSPKNILSIKPEEGRKGSAVINLMIENTKTLFQNLEKQLTLNF